ncbi:keratin-associated protein 14-like [Perognathus longimembris pacificus]|uniref:keratin-associated protein 14-like n=1 Tax=Perognathus longimembris pacificus TaxID=214514 RepID=UPI002018489D|nr:keratin-associated protein 14-like [Perognathus longimembris pacificus]
MAYNGCSGNISSCSFGGYLQYPVSSCGSSYPPNWLYSTDLQSPITNQLGYNDCQETFHEPTGFQSTCQQRPKVSAFYRPYQTACSGRLGFDTKGFQSSGFGSSTLGFGNGGFQSVGWGPQSFSSLTCRPNFYRPTYFSSKTCQAVSYQPGCRSGFY